MKHKITIPKFSWFSKLRMLFVDKKKIKTWDGVFMVNHPDSFLVGASISDDVFYQMRLTMFNNKFGYLFLNTNFTTFELYLLSKSYPNASIIKSHNNYRI